jgi:enolase
MTDISISGIKAIEILDSRGNPTIKVSVRLESGIVGSASVPSGASTGENEAVELRDGDPARYGGKGVLKAVAHVEGEIAASLKGFDAGRQADLDRRLIDLDGTPNKARLGANAILGVSMAAARAAAQAKGHPLYAYLAQGSVGRLPIPMMNVLNGGKHADSALDFQEFMIVPRGAPSFAEALRYGAETFHALKSILKTRGYATSVGDEGGFAPNLRSQEEACDLIVEAISCAGFTPMRDIAIALDPAATSFAAEGGYDLSRSGQGRRTTDQMIGLYREWVQKYPIVSIEDGLGEEDWDGFTKMTAELGDRIQIVGDDLYVTNTRYIGRGIATHATNAVLIKLNQIGTVTETIEAVSRCRDAGWGFVVSHRSGETDDAFMADFAVAMGAAQIKAGSASRGERLAKYNRLIEIERELGTKAWFSSEF